MLVCSSTFATEYYCQYSAIKDNRSVSYVGRFNPNKTAIQHCEKFGMVSDYCKNKEYPLALQAFKSGACKEIIEQPKTFNNIEGCSSCKAYFYKDGMLAKPLFTCMGEGSNAYACNADKAFKKVEFMLNNK